MPLKALVLCAMFGLGACSVMGRPAQLAQLPLPEPAQLSCCWQTEEKVQVIAPDRSLSLTAAVAARADGLTVVIFDPLGRRLATLVHRGGEPQTLSAPEGWPPELSRQLLIALYLHHLTPSQWRFSEPGWAVSGDAGQKALRYRRRELVHLAYPADSDGDRRTLRFAGKELTLHITTLSRTAL